MENFIDFSSILSIIGALVVVTNIVVQVLKNITMDKIPANILAMVVGMVLTVVAFFAYCQINCITVTWYMVVSAVVAGFFTAHAAMFGFDKLKETIDQVHRTKNK